MKQEMKEVKATIVEEIAQTVNDVQTKVKSNSEQIAAMGCDITAMGTDLKAIREATEPANLQKEVKNILLEEGAKKSGKKDTFYSEAPENAIERNYWKARRCLRIWPIRPTSEDKLWENVGEFLAKALQVNMDDVMEHERSSGHPTSHKLHQYMGKDRASG